VAATSTANARPAKGAAQDSLKLNRPLVNPTVRRKPTKVEAAKPMPMTAAHTRRTATTRMPTTRPPVDCAKNNGPMVAMRR
jgi:hypothetical protein